MREIDLARALGVSFKTWRRIREEDPAANEAWVEARAVEEGELVGLLMREARGVPAEFDENGKQVRAERPPYPAAAMFLLKTRHAYRDNGPADGAADTGPRIVINLPGPMSRDEWSKSLTIQHEDQP
ncbi:hypothetical protein FV226_24320 [Methylobacterium sp. WL12]|nr:hypothetical protein FV226_24320 [Methylobacterium sp. WL12]